MSSRKMNKEVKQAVDNTVDNLKKTKEVQAIYLFGSQATGKPKPYSDIDICVFTAQPLSWKKELRIYGASSKKLSISLFHKLPVYIQYRVIKEGIGLYIKDEQFVQKCEVSTVKNYLDFKPTLDDFIITSKCSI